MVGPFDPLVRCRGLVLDREWCGSLVLPGRLCSHCAHRATRHNPAKPIPKEQAKRNGQQPKPAKPKQPPAAPDRVPCCGPAGRGCPHRTTVRRGKVKRCLLCQAAFEQERKDRRPRALDGWQIELNKLKARGER